MFKIGDKVKLNIFGKIGFLASPSLHSMINCEFEIIEISKTRNGLDKIRIKNGDFTHPITPKMIELV